jgi:hypothetical protein
MIVVFALLAAASVHAGDGDAITFSGSGFLTIAAGRVLNGGDVQPTSGFNCPCFVSDYAQAGVYESGRTSLRPDSKLGLQGTATLPNGFSVTGQVVQRGANGGQTDFEWLYGSHKVNDKLTVQVGRKRLPLFYYSESQDVGLSYPWVHLSPQLYGWEVVNYNGLNLMYGGEWGEWTSRINVFVGDETVKDSGYWKIYNGRSTWTNSRWSNIRGADLTLSKDWLEVRFMHILSDIRNTTPPAFDFGVKTPQKIYGVSLHAESNPWVAHAEFLSINRMESYGKDFTQLYALGYRFGKLLPMLSYANYYQQQRQASQLNWDPEQSEAHRAVTLSLRYDLTPSSAVKMQYDRWMNRAKSQFFTASPNTVNPTGSANLLTVSYDMVF